MLADDSSPPAAAGVASLPARRRGLWALPLLLSLLFVAGVIVWAQRNDRDERDELRRTMISDALSTEAQLRGRLEVEAAHLRTLATQMASLPRTSAALAGQPEVVAGFRRLWISVTWLDVNNRIVAHVPEQVPALARVDGGVEDTAGVSSHLVARVEKSLPAATNEAAGEAASDGGEVNRFDVSGEKAVVRYSPAALLKRGVPWWLTRKYDAQLVDGSDQVIASVDDTPLRSAAGPRDSYRVLVGGGMPGVYLELTQRELPAPWWRALPVVLVAGFLTLIGVATALLRREVRQVSRAELAWRTEVAWRGAMEDSALVALRARDGEGRLLYVNRTFCDMVGLPAEALLGLTPPMPYWPPDALDEVMFRNRRNLAGQAPREGYEARWRHSDGHILDVMVFESPLVNAVGQQIGWMGSIIDITARKRLEERERRQTEAMAHQARLTTLGEVASALAHQLNQPLAAIAGYNAGVLRSLERAGFTEPAVLQAVRRLGEQAAEAGRIVQRIREFLTRRAPQREPCDLAATLRRAVSLMQRDLARQQVRVDWALAADLPAVDADPVLIEQVLINLVRNAADEMAGAAAQAGAGATTGGRIRITLARASERFVRVDVDDDGPGLRGRTIEQLCAPFYSTKADGMGMGLAICRSVIEAHHGGMDAGASPLGGARLSFTLPLQGVDDGIDEDRADGRGPGTGSAVSATPETAPEVAPRAVRP
jgi:two-component system, LuxR family, sensor histidine kinase DctS